MMPHISTITILLLSYIHDVASQPGTCSYVQTCEPTYTDIITFQRSLQGTLIMPHDMKYSNMTYMKALPFTAYPFYIVLVKDAMDVQKSLEFARKHRIRVTIYSSGHDYNGRSTATGSLQINFSLYKNISVNLSDDQSDTGSSVTAQAGASWLEVYTEVDKFKKIVVGGSAKTVSVSGYTMGGGYGPLTRSLGLAVDNVIEFTIILYDGTIAKCNKDGTEYPGRGQSTSDTDLFWAVRGGGGGTFGVVLSFKFKIHDAPSGFVQYTAFYPINLDGSNEIGKDLYKQIFEFISRLPNEWSGFFSSYSYDDPEKRTTALLVVSLLQNGPWHDKTKQTVQFATSYLVPDSATFTNYSTFLDYEKTVNDPIYVWSLVTNVLIDSKQANADHYNFFANDAVTPRVPYTWTGCTWILIGGKASEDNKDSAVSEHFRNSDVSSSCWVSWADPVRDERARLDSAYIDSLQAKLGKGAYLNEGAYYAENWAERYWGSNYNRLLDIKRRVDPENVFKCHHCIGSDDGMMSTDSMIASGETQHVINSLSLVSFLFSIINLYL